MSTITTPVLRLRTTRTVRALGASGLVLGLVGTAALGTTLPAQAAPAHDRAAQHLATTLRASGDPDGAGQARLTLSKDHGRVCAVITWSNIADPDAAHIHRRSDSSIVVDLSGAVNGGARCVTGVGHRLIGKILAHPRKYYVNVHNSTYPAGAIQGTLHR